MHLQPLINRSSSAQHCKSISQQGLALLSMICTTSSTRPHHCCMMSSKLPPSSPTERRLVQDSISKLKLPFPWKLHQLLDDVVSAGFEDVVSWLPGGHAFRVHKPEIFCKQVMTRYFRQTKYSSFTRQLYIYGFSKIEGGVNHGGYFHPDFKIGDKAAAMMLKRNSHTDHRQQKQHYSAESRSTSMLLPPGLASDTPRKSYCGDKSSSMGNNRGSDLVKASGNNEWNDRNIMHPIAEQYTPMPEPTGDFLNPVLAASSPTCSSSSDVLLSGMLREPPAQKNPLVVYQQQEHQTINRLLPSAPAHQTRHDLGQEAASNPSTSRPFPYWGAVGTVVQQHRGSGTGEASRTGLLVNAIDVVSREDEWSLLSNEASLFSIEPRSIEEMKKDPIWEKASHDTATRRYFKDDESN